MKSSAILRILSCCLVFVCASLHARDNDGFTRLYDDWTAAFNRKDSKEVCKLFSKNVVADYPGIPTRDYPTICNKLTRLLQEEERQYHYRYEFRNVYRSGGLAAIRITWFLTTTEGREKTTLVEQGLDVLQKNRAGKWEIVNWISYDDVAGTK